MILEFIFPPQFLPVCLNLRLTDIKGVPIGIKLCRKGVPVTWNIRTASLDRFKKKSQISFLLVDDRGLSMVTCESDHAKEKKEEGERLAG